MPNVAAAAADCLCKVASLVIGARALVARQIMPVLAELVVNDAADNLTVKERAAATLLQIYRAVPHAPRVDAAALAAALASPDPRLYAVLVALLDQLGAAVPGVAAGPDVVAMVQALQAADADARA